MLQLVKKRTSFSFYQKIYDFWELNPSKFPSLLKGLLMKAAFVYSCGVLRIATS